MSHLLLVIVRDLDLVSVTIGETKAYAPLIVDTNRILSLSILSELMKPIARRDPKVVYSRCQVHVLKLSPRSPSDVRREPFRPSGSVKLLRLFIREGFDHMSTLMRHVTIVNTESRIA